VSEYFKQHGYKNPSDGTDSPFQYAYDCKGVNFFDYFVRAPEMGRRFGSMMVAWSVGRPRWMDEGYYPVQERLIADSKQDDGAVFLVDVGGGRGHDLEGLKQAHPNIKGRLILQDKPEVISLAELSPGLEKMQHDFNTPQPIKGKRKSFKRSSTDQLTTMASPQAHEYTSSIPSCRTGVTPKTSTLSSSSCLP
jgi:hypothetical protein